MAILQDVAGGFAAQDLPGGMVLRAWLPENATLPERSQLLQDRVAALPEELLEDGTPEVCRQFVDEENWAEAWKAYWQPTRVGERLVIKPTWRDWPPPDQPDLAHADDLVIELDPGMAFGTGAHATTTLCLEALERTVPTAAKPARVIDLGCGSGILTIAALKLGAAEVIAIDSDPLATGATIENCERNGVQCEARLQAGLDGIAGEWDILIANISLPIIVATAPEAARLLALSGRFICSGFFSARQNEIVEAIAAAGLQVEHVEERENWGCLVARR